MIVNDDPETGMLSKKKRKMLFQILKWKKNKTIFMYIEVYEFARMIPKGKDTQSVPNP